MSHEIFLMQNFQSWVFQNLNIGIGVTFTSCVLQGRAEMDSLIFSSDPVWSQTTKSGFRQQVLPIPES